MPRITEFLAPAQEIRPSATGTSALELAARRIGPLYQEIARSIETEGKIEADKSKQQLWPLDILKLYEASNKAGGSGDTIKGGFSGVRLRVLGVNDTFGGPTETFSEDPTEDYDVSSRSHYQVRRGAAALGSALSNGYDYATGYGYAPTKKPNGGYPLEESLSGGPPESYDYSGVNKAHAAAAKANDALAKSANDYAGQVSSYWQKYYGSNYQGIPTAPLNEYDASGNYTGPQSTDTSSQSTSWVGKLSSFLGPGDSSSDAVASASIPSDGSY